MPKNIEKFFITLIFIGSAIILFLPLVVTSRTLFPYIFGKIIFFRIIVEVLFFCWLILAWFSKKYQPNFKSPLILSLIIFLAILFVTSLTGVDLQNSLWSTQERMTGVLTYLHFGAWLLILASCFKKDQAISLLKISLGVSVLASTYAIAQKLGASFLPAMAGALSGTFGNQIFIASYAMLHCFFAWFLFFQLEGRLYKAFVLIVAMMNFSLIVLALSRGVFMGLLVGVGIFLFLKILFSQSKIKKIILFTFLGFVLVGYIFLTIYLKNNPQVGTNLPGRRLFAVFDQNWSRFNSWQIAAQGFKDHPILGWGWENYNAIFNSHYNPETLKLGLAETWFDRSHNQVLDILCLAGIFSYLFFYF